MNGDGYCQDALYSLPAVANPSGNGRQGLVGLQDYTGTGGYPASRATIHGLGPEGPRRPRRHYTDPANAGSNKDNILSWHNNPAPSSGRHGQLARHSPSSFGF